MSPEEPPVTVILATDSFLIGDGLADLLADVPDIDVVGRLHHHDDLSAMVEELAPDAIILSIRTPIVTTMATVEAARRLRVDHPSLGIVVISDRGNGFALELLRDGASRIAYLLDDRVPGIDTVLGALRDIRAGQTVLDPSIVDALVARRHGIVIDDLTLREIDVLEQIAHGLSNRGIAASLSLSLKAVERYVTVIFRKLELTDQTLVDRRVTAALTFLRAEHGALPMPRRPDSPIRRVLAAVEHEVPQRIAVPPDDCHQILSATTTSWHPAACSRRRPRTTGSRSRPSRDEKRTGQTRRLAVVVPLGDSGRVRGIPRAGTRGALTRSPQLLVLADVAVRRSGRELQTQLSDLDINVLHRAGQAFPHSHKWELPNCRNTVNIQHGASVLPGGSALELRRHPPEPRKRIREPSRWKFPKKRIDVRA